MSIVERTSQWGTRLVEALVASRGITEQEGELALLAAGERHSHVAVVLQEQGLAEAGAAMRCLSAISGLRVVDLEAAPPAPEALGIVPHDLALERGVIGYRAIDNRLTLACTEPPDAETIRDVAAATGKQVDACVLAHPRQLARFLRGDEADDRRLSIEPEPDEPGAVGDLRAPSGRPAPAWIAPAVADVSMHPAVGGPAAAPRSAVHDRVPHLASSPAAAPHVAGPATEAARAGLHMDDLLRYAEEHGASDLHLTDRFPPAIRVDGAIRPIEGMARLHGEEIRRLVFAVIPQVLRERFEENKELDTSYALPGLGRFRVNVFQQRGSVGAVLRLIPDEVPDLESLGLPPAVGRLPELRKGLVLVTGPTGSGKSTTLAAVIRVINESKPLHIITVEDPIEYLHAHGRSIVNQREVGQDTRSFSASLRHALRQDPDVILVGEMRDLETISTALTAAETGHLVFATLHTQDAPQSIDRIIDVFPSHQQDQVRIQLAGALEAIVTQQLVLAASGKGRVAVAEVLTCTPGIRNLIRSAKTHQVYSLMQTGGGAGMQTMDQALAQAVREGRITESMALDRSRDPGQLLDYLRSPAGRLESSAR